MSADADDAALREAAAGFFLAAEHGRSDVIKALADHNDGRLDLARVVDPTTGRSPLHVAVLHRKTDALRVLLAAGFPPHVESLEAVGARTAYALAVEAQAHDLVFVFHQFAVQQVAMDSAAGVAQLLTAGVPLDVDDGAATGNTLLHWAVTCRARAVGELLLAQPAAAATGLVNRANAAEGATPLHLACRDGKLEFVQLLLAHGADPRCTGTGGFCRGKTPAELATSTEIRQLLERHEQRRLEASAVATTEPSESEEALKSASQAAAAPAPVEADAAVVEALRRKHALQLEEKDLLIRQLKTTIEALVVEAQEIRKLGEERTVLDYIRKLREEKEVVRRQLEDAEDHIRIQQQQIQELKRQIREMEPPSPLPPRPSSAQPQQQEHNVQLERESSQTLAPPVTSAVAATASATGATTPSEPDAKPNTVPPLRIDVTPPRSQRRSTPPRSSSGAWNEVWAVLRGNGLQADDVDADGEVIMTV